MTYCRCVCGGLLYAINDALLSKRLAVIEHNESPVHKAWRWHREH